MRRFSILVVFCVGGLLAACSDDGVPGQDLGKDLGSAKDLALDAKQKNDIKGDQGKQLDKGIPDAPKKPAYWEQIASPGPAGWSHTATLIAGGRVLLAGGTHKPKAVEGRVEAYVYLPVAKQVVAAGKMSTARGDHTATLLNNGKVLVAGGKATYTKYTATAELFDPAKYDPTKPGQNPWSKAPDMATPRSHHVAIKLKNGKVFLAGGYGGGTQLDSIEIYDPSANTWTWPATKLTAKRSAASAVLLKTGQVLISGGYDGMDFSDTLELYDPTKGTIAKLTAKLKSKRSGHTSTLLQDGRVLIAGGHCGSSCKLNSDEIYDPSKNSVTAISHPGTSETFGHTATLLQDGRVLIVGGQYTQQKVLAFSPLMGGSWTGLPGLKHGRYDHTATRLTDGTVLVVSGQVSAGSYGPPVDKVELFHP